MAGACLFTKRTAMSASAIKDSQEHTAKWVKTLKRRLSSISVNSSKGTNTISSSGSSSANSSSSNRECI